MGNSRFRNQRRQQELTEGPSRRLSLVAWDDVSDAEKGLLERVESRVLETSEQLLEQEEDTISHNAQGLGMHLLGLRWATLMVIVGLAGLLGWSQWKAPLVLPNLHMEGTLKMHPAKEGKPQGQRLQLTLQKNAKLRDPQRWSLRSHADTLLRVERSSLKKSRVILRKGAIAVHVIPGSMKQFVVDCPEQLQVVVKGTKFLVWQNKAGTRIEVTKGHVVVRKGKRELIHLYKGQGVQIRGLKDEVLQTYRIPEKAKSDDWLSKLDLLAQKQKAHLFAYAKDLAQGRFLSRKERLQVLESAAHALQGEKHWKQASRLWLQMYKLQPKGFEAQTALYQAASNCRLSKSKRQRCATLFSRYLKGFPKGLPSLRESSLFWLGALQLQLQKPQKELAQKYLQRYLKHFSSGLHAVQARKLLAQITKK